MCSELLVGEQFFVDGRTIGCVTALILWLSIVKGRVVAEFLECGEIMRMDFLKFFVWCFSGYFDALALGLVR